MRIQRAVEHYHARSRRVNAQTITVDAGTTYNLTPLVPTAIQLGEAPYSNLLFSYSVDALPDDLIQCAVTDDNAVQIAIYDWTDYADHIHIICRVPTLWPYDAAQGALVTPLHDAAGAPILNYVYLINPDVVTDRDVHIVFEIPDLDYQ